MRDTKSLLLLIVSSLLLVVSCILLWTWGYRVYQISKTEKNGVAPAGKRPANPALLKLDSSQNFSANNINLIEKNYDSVWGNADSLKIQLGIKLNEFNKLRNEISEILKKPGNSASLGVARQKIGELQQIVEELRSRNKDVENENKRLNEVLAQLSDYMKSPVPNAKRVAFEEKPLPVTTNDLTAGFTASELKLSAIMHNEDKEEETLQAQQTEKLVGSFIVKNNGNPTNSSEMMIVVIQPDGQVLKTSAWESGTFNSEDGKKIYSYKMRFEITKGETRRLLFTLSTDKYQKGNYTMQIYHNGMLIGKMFKTLS